MNIYIVKEGDTLSGIAELFDVSVSRLAYDNEIIRSELVVGQALIILNPDIVYTVKNGDTLYGIANSFGISVNDILRNNSYLLNENFLVPGREIIISYERNNEEKSTTDIYGYAYPFIKEDVLEEACLYIDELLPFSYGFNEDGTLIYLNDEGLIENALRFDNRLRMVITPLDRNGRFNNQQVVKLLSDENVQDILIDIIISVMNDKGYSALDIDFEFIPGQFRSEYVSFVTKVRSRLNEYGYNVSVALPPKVSSDQPGLLYEGIDYAGDLEMLQIVCFL